MDFEIARAKVINWLFDCCYRHDIYDKTLFFSAVAFGDNYYNKTGVPQYRLQHDLELSYLVSLFLASKFTEVEPIGIDMILVMNDFGFS